MTDASLPISQIVQDLPRLIERMHRRYLDVVRLELSRHGYYDISPVQAVMLGMIGGVSGSGELSVRDLIERGYYLGSNASYNIKNLIEGGYVERQTAMRDKRLAQLRLSEKGRNILEVLTKLNESTIGSFAADHSADISATFHMLRRIEHQWTEAIRSEVPEGLEFS